MLQKPETENVLSSDKKQWRLASGELVVDKENSHIHEMLDGLFDEAIVRINSGGRNKISEEIDFGRDIGKCALVETNDEDEVFYALRPRRSCLARFVKNRKADSCSTLTIILEKGVENKFQEVYYVVVTAYVGHVSYPFPWDKKYFNSPEKDDEKKKAVEFWKNKALIPEIELIVPGTETDVCPKIYD